MPTGKTVALSAEGAAETARLLAIALHDDPAYAFLLPDASVRPSGLAHFFRRHLANHVPHGCSFVREHPDGRVAATVTLRPPGGVSVSAVALMRGLIPFALAYGPSVIRRLSQLRDRYEELERRAADGARYWHVHMMAVRPELQGQGIGGALLDDVLSAAPRATQPTVLTTHKEINVRFYERVGFFVAAEETLRLPGTSPYPVWCMRRDAR